MSYRNDMNWLAVFLVGVLLAAVLYASGDPAVVAVSPPEPDFWVKLQGVLAGISAKIPLEGYLVVVATILAEAVLRLFPSEKPRSILLAVANIFMLLSEIFRKLAALLNRVIPQKLNEPSKLEGPK